MPSPHLLLAFFATAALFACIPGPAMLYAAARTLASGRRAGLMASLGIHLGGYAHVMTAAAGLSILLKTVPVLYATVRLAGALYLIWLGVALVRTRAPGDADRPVPHPPEARRAFAQSVAVEVLNPKTAMFFLAFLPQFTDATTGAGLCVQLLVLGTIVNLMFSAADVICVLLADAVMASVQRSERTRRLLQRTGGAVLIGLGADLALPRG